MGNGALCLCGKCRGSERQRGLGGCVGGGGGDERAEGLTVSKAGVETSVARLGDGGCSGAGQASHTGLHAAAPVARDKGRGISKAGGRCADHGGRNYYSIPVSRAGQGDGGGEGGWA